MFDDLCNKLTFKWILQLRLFIDINRWLIKSMITLSALHFILILWNVCNVIKFRTLIDYFKLLATKLRTLY